MRTYKYRDNHGLCCHKRYNGFHSKNKIKCYPDKCPYLNECEIVNGAK